MPNPWNPILTKATGKSTVGKTTHEKDAKNYGEKFQ